MARGLLVLSKPHLSGSNEPFFWPSKNLEHFAHLIMINISKLERSKYLGYCERTINN